MAEIINFKEQKLERDINRAYLDLCNSMNWAECRKAAQSMRSLIAQRTPETIRKMEIERRLVQ